MPDVVTLLKKYGPRCAFCGEFATRITVPLAGFELFEAWCEDFSTVIHSTSMELASEVARNWLWDLISVDLVRRGSSDLRVNVLVPFREGWYYCDKHQNDDPRVCYQVLPRAHLVRALPEDVETVSIERPTRFERILDSDV